MSRNKEPEGKKEAAESSLHAGHRERMKAQFLKSGFDGLEDHQVLEQILFFSIPQKDTNPLAHQLLNKFGSFSGVLDAPYSELLTVKGVGPHTAYMLKTLSQVARRYFESLDLNKVTIYSSDAAADYLISKFIGRSNEVIILMLLDSKSRIIFCDVVSEGTATTANIYIKKIVKLAVEYNAVYAMLAHNHPSGSCLPSQQDLDSTLWVHDALDAVDVRLLDHIIISGKDHCAFSKAGIQEYLFFDEEEIRERHKNAPSLQVDKRRIADHPVKATVRQRKKPK